MGLQPLDDLTNADGRLRLESGRVDLNADKGDDLAYQVFRGLELELDDNLDAGLGLGYHRVVNDVYNGKGEVPLSHLGRDYL